MASILSIIGAVTGVLPFIQTVITGIEGLFGSGNGPQKLEGAVSASLAALQAYAAATGKTLPASIQDDIQAAVNANVKIMNDMGLLMEHTVHNPA